MQIGSVCMQNSCSLMKSIKIFLNLIIVIKERETSRFLHILRHYSFAQQLQNVKQWRPLNGHLTGSKPFMIKWISWQWKKKKHVFSLVHRYVWCCRSFSSKSHLYSKSMLVYLTSPGFLVFIYDLKLKTKGYFCISCNGDNAKMCLKATGVEFFLCSKSRHHFSSGSCQYWGIEFASFNDLKSQGSDLRIMSNPA